MLKLGFLLLVSMLVTTALAAVGKYLAPCLPEAALQIVSIVVSFAVISLLLAMMFKRLPDTVIACTTCAAVAMTCAFEASPGNQIVVSAFFRLMLWNEWKRRQAQPTGAFFRPTPGQGQMSDRRCNPRLRECMERNDSRTPVTRSSLTSCAICGSDLQLYDGYMPGM
jgi:hypothetical protein